MSIILKRMETDEEIKGKALVHWQAWHEAYPGLVSQEYLDAFTLAKCEKIAFSWTGEELLDPRIGATEIKMELVH